MCFVANILENEQAYKRAIQVLNIGEELSFDHTFKVAANIGYWCDDRKWVCQCNSIFLVFNGEGNIVSWQFTKGTGFHHVKTLLEAIRGRLQSQNQAVKVVYTGRQLLPLES
jgi:hypothetical protein